MEHVFVHDVYSRFGSSAARPLGTSTPFMVRMPQFRPQNIKIHPIYPRFEFSQYCSPFLWYAPFHRFQNYILSNSSRGGYNDNRLSDSGANISSIEIPRLAIDFPPLHQSYAALKLAFQPFLSLFPVGSLAWFFARSPKFVVANHTSSF